MPDEHPIGIRIEGKQPPIAVGAVVNLSGPNDHAICSMLPLLNYYNRSICPAGARQSSRRAVLTGPLDVRLHV